MLDHKTKHETQLAIEQVVMGTAFDANPVSSLIADDLDHISRTKFQRIPAWLSNIESVGFDVVAHISLMALLDKIGNEGKGCGQAHGIIGAIANKLGLHRPDLTYRQRCGLAFNILHAMREAGLVRLTLTKRGEPTIVANLTTMVRDMLTEHDLWGLQGLSNRPMIVPPVPHTLGYKGGYLTYELRKGITHGSWDNIKREDIVDGMNAIQATEWAIRERVLEVAEYLLEPYMQARDTNEYAHNTSLRIAREYVGMPLWMPTYCDFRGRILEQPEPLSYQGNDLNRGTLTFHEEVDITDEGLPWLFVHVANTCSGLPMAKGIKLDKLPFEDRIIWVRDNIRVLLDIAQDPYGNKDLYWDGFGKGAKTFQALASCDELYKVVTTNKTSIPCVGDGTQNNYQWSAGLIRDKDLAVLVNLLPCSKPNDLHQAVGDANREAWEAGESDHEYMPEFLERADVLCDRSTVKPASMVIGYNGTARGIGKHLLGKKAWENTGTDDEPSWVLVAHQDSALSGIDIPLDEHSKASFCLAQDYEKAVYKVAPSAKEVSNFVTECVDVANDNGQPMRWMSVAGIVVINRPTTREEFTLHGANCWLDQTCTQLKFGVFTDELDKRKARTAAPPNFTHSLDGSHMAISCKRFVLEVKGICLPDEKVAIASIMDCYGTHANRVPMFRKIIINTFVDILMLDPLKALADSYGVELPAYGELDLEETRQAEYLLG